MIQCGVNKTNGLLEAYHKKKNKPTAKHDWRRFALKLSELKLRIYSTTMAWIFFRFFFTEKLVVQTGRLHDSPQPCNVQRHPCSTRHTVHILSRVIDIALFYNNQFKRLVNLKRMSRCVFNTAVFLSIANFEWVDFFHLIFFRIPQLIVAGSAK